MIICSLFFVAFFALINLISCSNKILIVSEGGDDPFIKSIRDQSLEKQMNIEDFITGKMPSILTADDEPIYHSIYYLKSSWNENFWSASQVANFVQNGGNFINTCPEKM